LRGWVRMRQRRYSLRVRVHDRRRDAHEQPHSRNRYH
jgi:hypothetical protein